MKIFVLGTPAANSSISIFQGSIGVLVVVCGRDKQTYGNLVDENLNALHCARSSTDRQEAQSAAHRETDLDHNNHKLSGEGNS